jgi:hypothetical protein
MIIAFTVLVSCNLKKEEKVEQKPADAPQQAQQAMGQPAAGAKIEGNKIFLADFSFEIPSTWVVEQPTSSMRISQFGLKSNQEIKIIGFYFGNNDNMIEANIERWKNEFTNVESVKNSKAANDLIEVVLITGTFKKKPYPMAQEFEEAPNYSTMACIIPSKEGPYFFKAWGPKEEIAKELSVFTNFLNTYKK